MRLKELAQKIGAIVSGGSADVEIQKIAPITTAGAGDLTFVANPDYFQFLAKTKASAVILKEARSELAIPQLIHPDPYLAFAKAANLFYAPSHGLSGIHEQAVVSPDAQLGDGITIGPFAYVGARARLGARVVLYPGAYVGDDVVIDDDTVIYPNVVIGERCVLGKRCVIHAGTVIGADGFGFASGVDEIVKIPQVGIVRIEDDVELGACTTVDRAALGETLVKRGTKCDSKVHIGHNAVIGENCLFAAQTAIAGSARVGNWVRSGGHAGIAGHLTVGDRVSIGAMTGVIKDAEPGETYMGFPAAPAGEWRRRQVYFKRLAEFDKRLKELEKRLGDK